MGTGHPHSPYSGAQPGTKPWSQLVPGSVLGGAVGPGLGQDMPAQHRNERWHGHASAHPKAPMLLGTRFPHLENELSGCTL